VVTGGRPAPLPSPRGAPPAMSTPALWTLLAPCANICRMTAVAPESVATQPEPTVEAPAAPVADEELVLADLLVEEISIDGMCGVY